MTRYSEILDRQWGVGVRLRSQPRYRLVCTGESPPKVPLWGPNRFWPGSGLVLRCLGPGFTVLALGPEFRPILIVKF